MDETSQKIIDVTMALVRDKGYVATTTKDIAKDAQINECTIFRKFKGKKDIVLSGMKQQEWRANITPDVFKNVKWNLQEDLEMFMNNYLDRVNADFVNLSIGLRAPQIYDETAALIMKIPEIFIQYLTTYFEKMHDKGKLAEMDFHSLAITIFSSTFGYTFLKASFEDKLIDVKQKDYVEQSVKMFINGIQKNS
ncbi:TetR family transcriptional regulator [Acetobacterium fimetarium]|uniref:TetR family transcriptional regulator n=1 Tax=Acetobacterium fimetarium TaxID=52691 RepID=A0ABR6WUL0_9FIRM|nr:TetR/AcrR family transcriptional regulator [Acetobacterium fimetarium]MBC3804297.1 TetR family transcriptional regulator [Acetobacterium fimetarium]